MTTTLVTTPWQLFFFLSKKWPPHDHTWPHGDQKFFYLTTCWPYTKYREFLRFDIEFLDFLQVHFDFILINLLLQIHTRVWLLKTAALITKLHKKDWKKSIWFLLSCLTSCCSTAFCFLNCLLFVSLRFFWLWRIRLSTSLSFMNFIAYLFDFLNTNYEMK